MQEPEPWVRQTWCAMGLAALTLSGSMPARAGASGGVGARRVASTTGIVDVGGETAAGEAEECRVTCTAPPGKSQSPIRIDETRPSTLRPPQPDYKPAGVVLWNTGKNLQVDYAPSQPPNTQADNLLVLDGATFTLIEFHFHRPGEHVWRGVRPEMELHLVHRDAAGGLAVLGVPMAVKAGAGNTAIARLWDHLPGRGERRYLPDLFDAASLLAASRGKVWLRYPGSLTTGTCAEGVRWSLAAFDGALVISPEQYRRYLEVFPETHCRATQPLNGRVPLLVGP